MSFLAEPVRISAIGRRVKPAPRPSVPAPFAARPRRRSVLLAQAWWEERIFRGVARYAGEHGWELQHRMHWTHQLPSVSDWRGDGIIVFTGISRNLRRLGRSLVRFVRAARVPVVEMQAFGDYFGAPRVVVAHEDIGRTAAEHYLALGYRDLAFVTFDENLLEQHRRLGFQRAAEAAGARWHPLTPRELTRSFARLPRPLAMLAANDANALEVIRLVQDAGGRVPEEFAVMGIDDTEIVCDLAAVPLSSVNCDHEQQGYEAAAMLDRLMSGGRKPAAPVVVRPRGVTVRRSTDTVAIPDLPTARVLRSLRDRYRERVSVEQIVRDLGVPLRQVHTKFREHVGRTLLQELTRLRVAHAEKLLADPKLKFTAVALESGFSSRFHFTAAFRRVTGKTPKAFRAALRE